VTIFSSYHIFFGLGAELNNVQPVRVTVKELFKVGPNGQSPSAFIALEGENVGRFKYALRGPTNRPAIS
jgi:hypothetical protein